MKLTIFTGWVVAFVFTLLVLPGKTKGEAEQGKIVFPEYLVVESNHFPKQLYTWNVLFPQKSEFKMGFYVSPSFAHEFGFYLEGDSLFWARAVGPFNIYMKYSHECDENASRHKQLDDFKRNGVDNETGRDIDDEYFWGDVDNMWSKVKILMSGRNYSEKYVQRGEIKLGKKRAEEFRKTWDLVIAQSRSLSPEYQEIFDGMDGRTLYYADSQGNVCKDRFCHSFPMRSHLEAFCHIVGDMGLLNDSSEEAMEIIDCGLRQLRADAHRLAMKKVWLPALPPGLVEEYPKRERDMILDPEGRDASDMENERSWKDMAMSEDILPVDLLMNHLVGKKGMYHSLFPGKRRGSPGLIMAGGDYEKIGVLLVGNLLFWAEVPYRSWVPAPYEYAPVIGSEEVRAVARGCVVLPDELVKGMTELINLLSGACVMPTKNGERDTAIVAFSSEPVSPRKLILLPGDKIFKFIRETFSCATSPYMGKEGVELLIPLMESALKEAREIEKHHNDAS